MIKILCLICRLQIRCELVLLSFRDALILEDTKSARFVTLRTKFPQELDWSLEVSVCGNSTLITPGQAQIAYICSP